MGRQTLEVVKLRLLFVSYTPWIVRLELPHLPAEGVSRVWGVLRQGQYGSESQESE